MKLSVLSAKERPTQWRTRRDPTPKVITSSATRAIMMTPAPIPTSARFEAISEEVVSDKLDVSAEVTDPTVKASSKVTFTRRQRARQRAKRAQEARASRRPLRKEQYKGKFDCVLVELINTPQAESCAKYRAAHRCPGQTAPPLSTESMRMANMSAWTMTRHQVWERHTERPQTRATQDAEESKEKPGPQSTVAINGDARDEATEPSRGDSGEDSDASSWASESFCGKFDDTSSDEESDDGTLNGSTPTKAGSQSATTVVKKTYKDLAGAHLSKPEENVNIQPVPTLAFKPETLKTSLTQAIVDAAHAVTRQADMPSPPDASSYVRPPKRSERRKYAK